MHSEKFALEGVQRMDLGVKVKEQRTYAPSSSPHALGEETTLKTQA